ncbi:MAG: glycosyltransferase family 1 protein [Sphingobacteriaceae bacterium]|jgi:glycosyltransferase involved in cell wall biosynthesis|nr:glycosyltransferase family 1 protein [Sphingobacteriaceae bacterium]
MVKVFFDHQKFTTQKYGGISRYFANIINQIKLEKDFSYLMGVLYSRNHYIKGERQPLNNAVGNTLLQSTYGTKAFKVNQAYCNYLLKKNEFDVFHPTYYDPYFFGKLKKPLVTTIHDMTHERLPEYFWGLDPLSRNKRLNIEYCDHIIAISETTKKDLLKYSDVDESKVSVIYHGIDLDEPFRTFPVANLPENYLLFVGDRSGYKNFYLFLDAFKHLSDKYPDIKTVLTGGGGLCVAELEYINHFRLQDKIMHVNVSDEELNFLYQNAMAFVYPSLHEGFGLPILEAFKAQCPIILSDTDCFREIGADAAVYFEARRADSLFEVVQKLISSSDERKRLVAKGSERLLDFPLSKSMAETLEVYQKLA